MQNRPEVPRTSSQLQSCPVLRRRSPTLLEDTLVDIQALHTQCQKTVISLVSFIHRCAFTSRCPLFSTLKIFKTLSPSLNTPHTQLARRALNANSLYFSISLPIHTNPFVSFSIPVLHHQYPPSKFSLFAFHRHHFPPSPRFRTHPKSSICESEPGSQNPPESHSRLTSGWASSSVSSYLPCDSSPAA